MASPTDVLPVTIIVPTYNRAELLRDAIASLLGQSRPAAQILVIDDGSTDETAVVATAFGQSVTCIKMEGNQGKAAALNHGLALAEHDYIWIFDDDDVADPAALERLYEALAVRPDCGFAYGLCDRFSGSWPSPTTPPYGAYSAPSRAVLYIRLLEEHFMWQGAMLVRRACYAEIGSFNTVLLRSVDYEMVLRLARRFGGVDVPQILFHQRQHPGVRGPGHISLEPAQVFGTWKKFDQIILRAVHGSHGLAEFLNDPPRAAIGPRESMTALIQRASIMARAGIWDLATADMTAAAEQARQASPSTLNAQELTALRRVFERWARSAFGNVWEGRDFFAAVDQFQDPGIRNSIKAALIWPILYRLKKLVQEDSWFVQAREVGLILRCVGIRAVGHAISGRKLRAEPLVAVVRQSGARISGDAMAQLTTCPTEH